MMKHAGLGGLLVFTAWLLLLGGSGMAAEESSVPAITILGRGAARTATLLAIDDASLPLRKNLGFYLSRPTVRAEAVLKPSPFGSGAPDDLAAHFSARCCTTGPNSACGTTPVTGARTPTGRRA